MIPGSANPLLLTSADSGYAIERSLRFNPGDSAYLNRTPSAAGNRKTWTLSTWIKKCGEDGNAAIMGATGTPSRTACTLYNGQFYIYSGQGINVHTTGEYRDPSAWYHVVFVLDTTQATAADRTKIYINGEQPQLTYNTSPGQNTEWTFNNTGLHEIGKDPTAGEALNGYLADVHFIDGQALAPTDFGETDEFGVWQPKEFAGSYGLPFYLGDFESQTTGTPYDSVRALDHVFDGDDNTYAAASAANTINFTLTSPITGITAVKLKLMRDATAPVDGLVLNGTDISSNFTAGQTSEQTISATNLTSLTWNTSASNQWWGLYFIKVVKDGVTYELIQQTSNNSFHLDFADNSSNAALGTDTSGVSPANTWTVNNLMASVPGLATANQGMDVVTWTGNGGDRDIGGLAFQPDFVWIKKRNSSSSGDHMLYDVVRGATKVLKSNSTAAEITDASTLDAFNSDGFSIGGGWEVNKSGDTYVAWTWKAGGAASSNTDGTITSSVSASNTYGFSIVSFTDGGSACTLGHGLSSAPKMIFAKFRGASGNWSVYHESIGNDHRLKLNLRDAKQSGNDWWNATSPTSSVFSLGSNLVASTTQVAYCWSEIAGFSKFSSYTGSGGSKAVTGLGFKPKYVLMKSSSKGATSWMVADSSRGDNQILRAHSTDAETTESISFSFDADGFSFNTSNDNFNESGQTYIYAAFAAKPDGSVIDSLVDTPSNAATPTDTGVGNEVVGNYATLNPLQSATTLSNGNLDSAGGSGWSGTAGTFGMSSGKWYFEYDNVVSNEHIIGIVPSTTYTLNTVTAYGYGSETGGKYSPPSSSNVSYGDSWGAGDVIGVAFDADAGNLYFYKNGTVQNSGTAAFTGLTSGPYLPSVVQNGSSRSASLNFGQRAFSHPVSGYKSLNTSNLSSTIADGSKYFDTKLFTGTGSTLALTMANSELSPDFVWIKNRNSTYQHLLFDAVRGATKYLKSDATSAEQTNGSTLASFDSNGFTLGGDNEINRSSYTYASWTWDAGDSNTTIAAGSLNSSVYNQSQSAWQNYLTTTNGNGFPDSNHPVTWAFDGHLNHHTYTGDDDIYFTPSGGVSFTITSQVRIRSYWDTTVTVETSAGTFGPVTSSSSGTWQWTTVSCSGTLTKITIRRVNGANLSGIEIDGILLVNSGITPATNVPSIASTVRSSPESGFSLVSYTGTGANATVGHGLNAAPKMIITKNISAAASWAVYHSALGNGSLLELEKIDGAKNSASAWNSTDPTSSVFSVGNYADTNNQNEAYIAYCFAPVEGYSAMGSYTGNGSADGPFVYTGFRPAFVLRKSSSSNIANWTIMDQERDPINQMSNILRPDLSNAEVADQYSYMDILSNGFKVKSSGAYGNNVSGTTYIYLAFASNPFASNGGLAR